jgi:hypothetical protein
LTCLTNILERIGLLFHLAEELVHVLLLWSIVAALIITYECHDRRLHVYVGTFVSRLGTGFAFGLKMDFGRDPLSGPRCLSPLLRRRCLTPSGLSLAGRPRRWRRCCRCPYWLGQHVEHVRLVHQLLVVPLVRLDAGVGQFPKPEETKLLQGQLWVLYLPVRFFHPVCSPEEAALLAELPVAPTTVYKD